MREAVAETHGAAHRRNQRDALNVPAGMDKIERRGYDVEPKTQCAAVISNRPSKSTRRRGSDAFGADSPLSDREVGRREARRHHVITKTLAIAAVVGFCVAKAAPAGADPNSIGTDPNPFGTLGCSCQQTAPAGSPTLMEEIRRGIRQGLSSVDR